VETKLIGLEKQVAIAPDRAAVQIGERIKPTGRKRLSQALARGDSRPVEQEARARRRSEQKS
jgi:cobalamin-dependent methionine synthase I